MFEVSTPTAESALGGRKMDVCGGTLICEEPTVFELHDGLVYVSSGCAPVRAFRLHTFYASFRNAAQCIQRCNGASGEIVEFPRLAEH